VSALKLAITCLPTPVVKWFVSKFEMHPHLSEEATVVIDGNQVYGKDKIQFINSFNEATFLKKYYVHPGNEQYYVHPGNNEIPVIIDTKIGKRDVRLFVYSYKDRVDVVKQYKKKILAYSLLSDNLQKRSA